MSIINWFISFLVALIVSLLVYWVGSSIFHIQAMVANIDLLGLFCFVLFLGLLFGGYGYFNKKPLL